MTTDLLTLDEAKRLLDEREPRRQRHHDHADSILIARAWLLAQQRTQKPHKRHTWALKHMIEAWGGCYVSADDVSAAALMIGLRGRYPWFDLSTRPTLPHWSRLDGIGQAWTQSNYCDRYVECDIYKRADPLFGSCSVAQALSAYRDHREAMPRR